MKEKIADEVILTPMYKGEVYKYHECSNCKKEIYFEEDTCNYESIGCTKCWTNALKKVKREN